MPPGVVWLSVLKIGLFWHHKWACPSRCVLDRSVYQPSGLKQTLLIYPLNILGGHAHLWCQKRQILKTWYNVSPLTSSVSNYSWSSLRISNAVLVYKREGRGRGVHCICPHSQELFVTLMCSKVYICVSCVPALTAYTQSRQRSTCQWERRQSRSWPPQGPGTQGYQNSPLASRVGGTLDMYRKGHHPK